MPPASYGTGIFPTLSARGRKDGRWVRPIALQRCLIPLIILMSVIPLGGCNPFPKTWEWNQKLTVEVATPSGVSVGSAVTRVRWQEENSVGNYPGSYSGEATFVDMGNGRYLFALLSEETRYLALRTFADVLGDRAQISEEGFEAASSLRGENNVPAERYPLLVTFEDIRDPATVKRVDPNNLADSFGSGFSLQRITLEITEEPTTKGAVEGVLGWLEEVGKERGSLIPNPPRLISAMSDPEIQTLGPLAFSTELFK